MSGHEPSCQQCGAIVIAGSLFCSKCGADVTMVHGPDAETLEVTAVGTPAPRIQSTMRQMLRDATLGEYEILSEVGRGGMATVFLAHDISLDRKVAIKLMAPHLLEGEGMAERFKLEARTAAQLSHPHIIPIYAVKETEATLFFVMKFVEGKPLDHIIKRMGQLPIPMVKDILSRVGSALGYAHRRGVVHRDVKPGNVLIDEEGTPIVTDFGIAKVAEAKGLTMTGTTIGTPSYMSPEQCEAKEVTGASDQYSLGVVAWEMLTGSPPFAGDSAVTTMYKHCHEPLPPLKDFRPDCPSEVLETVTRMLAKSPSDRWPSLEAAIRKLGSTTQDQLDPIRRELLELARETDPRELIAQLSTPRSPMPSVAAPAHASASVPTAPTPAPTGARRSWFPLAAMAAVVVSVAGSALAVLQPWASGGTTPEVDGGTPPGAPQPDGVGGGGTAAAAEPAGDEAVGGQDGRDQADGGQAAASVGAQAPGGESTVGGEGSGAQPAASGGAPEPVAGNTVGGVAAGGGAPQPRPAVVANVRVDGARSGLEPGDQLRLAAVPLGAGGRAVQGGAPRWSASPTSVGSVSPEGVFTASAAGSVTVTAVIDGVSGSTEITVVDTRVASLTGLPASVSLAQGETRALSAQPRTQSGGTVQAQVAWSSSATGVATVSPGGEVQAVAPGTAVVTASAGGVSQSVDVTVAAPVVDARTAITELVASYARALESGDIQEVRRAYPGMTAEQEQNLRLSIESIERADFRVVSFQEEGDAATATVEGTYGFVTNGRRTTSQPFTFRATFARSGAVWRMIRTE